MIEWLTNPCVLFMLVVHALFACAAWSGSVQAEPRAPEHAAREGVSGYVFQAALAGFYPTVILAFPLLALREAVLQRYPLLPAGSSLGAVLWLYAAAFGATLLYLTRRTPRLGEATLPHGQPRASGSESPR